MAVDTDIFVVFVGVEEFFSKAGVFVGFLGGVVFG